MQTEVYIIIVLTVVIYDRKIFIVQVTGLLVVFKGGDNITQGPV
jgi:hypothetical protein